MQKILLMNCFKEDCRVSMDYYSESLKSGINNQKKNFFARSFTPQISQWLQVIPDFWGIKMRFSRFFTYPMQARKLDADVFHILDHGYTHLLPILDPSKCVVTVHDLIPILAHRGLINGMKASFRPAFVEFSLSFLRKAAGIITVSNNSKKDIEKLLNCRSKKIHVIHNGVSKLFCPQSKENRNECRKKFPFPEKNGFVILITGAIDYKNHETSIKILKELQKVAGKPVYLVRVGGESPAWKALVDAYSVNDRVFSTGFLSADELASLYGSVDLLLFPSLYEGFGMPPIEAMACGTPVAVSNAGSLPEVVGDCAIIADPLDVMGFCEQIRSLFSDRQVWKKYREMGLDWSKKFSWDLCAEKTCKVYEQILEKF